MKRSFTLRRKLKQSIQKKQYKNPTNNLLTKFAIFSIVSFIVLQLLFDSMLVPLGKELSDLNQEKDYLLSEIRKIQEDSSIKTSINVSSYIAQKKLNLKDTDKIKTIRITDNVVATR